MSPLAPRPGDPAFGVPAREARPRRRLHLLAIGVPLILVLAVAALFGARLWLEAFLRSADFRQFLDRKTSALLHAESRLEPLHWEGSEVYSDALTGTGYPGSPWKRLNVEAIRAELNLRALWNGVWRIDSIDLAKVRASLGADAGQAAAPALAPAEAEGAAPAETSLLGKLLPSKVEVGKIAVADFSLSWGDNQPGAAGRLQGAELTAHPRQEDGVWEVTGRKGRLTQGRIPALLLDVFTLQASERELTITQASAQVEGGGRIELTGSQQLGGAKDLALDATCDGIPSESFLPADWRARLHGFGRGVVHVTGSSELPDGWRVHGHVDLRNGHLETLPVLDELAIFTATARFRQATLQRAGADFDWQAGVLTVSRLEIESEGLIRLEGGFTVRNEQMDGQLQLGVARSAGRLLAGVGARVFTEPERDGYLWTTVHLTGSARDPHEDLTARLVQATQEEVVEKAKQGAGTVLDTASSLLNLLQPRQ